MTPEEICAVFDQWRVDVPSVKGSQCIRFATMVREAFANQPGSTTTESGWALRRKSDGAWWTTHGSGVGRMKLWTRTKPDGHALWEIVRVTRTITVQEGSGE